MGKGSASPKGSAVALPMGKGCVRPEGLTIALPTGKASQGLGHCLNYGERGKEFRFQSVRPKSMAVDLTTKKEKKPEQCSSQEFSHCLADGRSKRLSREVIVPKARPLPCLWGKRRIPERCVPAERCSSQKLGHYLADGEYPNRQDPEECSWQGLGQSLAATDPSWVQQTPWPKVSWRSSARGENKMTVSGMKVKTASSREDTVGHPPKVEREMEMVGKCRGWDSVLQ